MLYQVIDRSTQQPQTKPWPLRSAQGLMKYKRLNGINNLIARPVTASGFCCVCRQSNIGLDHKGTLEAHSLQTWLCSGSGSSPLRVIAVPIHPPSSGSNLRLGFIALLCFFFSLQTYAQSPDDFKVPAPNTEIVFVRPVKHKSWFHRHEKQIVIGVAGIGAGILIGKSISNSTPMPASKKIPISTIPVSPRPKPVSK